MREIRIVKKPDGNVEPEDGFRTSIQQGQTVLFTAPGSKGVSIEFVEGSPFSEPPVYGKELTVTAPGGVFGYLCEIKIGDEVFKSKNKNAGGEIEVPPGP
jgi:hypothetical protein